MVNQRNARSAANGTMTRACSRRIFAHVSAGGAALMLVVGCASPLDKRPFEDWSDTNRRWHSGQGDGPHASPQPTAEARPDSPGVVLADEAGLDDCVHYAIRHNPALAAAFYRWKAALERVPQAKTLPDPQVSFGIVFDEVDRRGDYMGERYSLSQMFPLFGKLTMRGDVAMHEAMTEARMYEAQRLALAEQVVREWMEYAYLRRAAQVAQDNLTLLVHLEEVARSRFRVGEAKVTDLTRAQVELGRLDDQATSLKDMLQSAAAALNATMGRAGDLPLPSNMVAPSAMLVTALPSVAADDWRAAALLHNPELAALQHGVSREMRGIALARQDSTPDVTVGVEYARNGSARMAMMDGGGSDMLMAMVSINLPIWREKYAASTREAKARFAAATHQVHDRRNTLAAELQRVLFDYRDADRKVGLYGGTLLPQAHHSLATVEAGYRTGDATFTDLVDSQRILLDFELAHERAAADRMIAVARLHRLVGIAPDQVQSPGDPNAAQKEDQQ